MLPYVCPELVLVTLALWKTWWPDAAVQSVAQNLVGLGPLIAVDAMVVGAKWHITREL